MSKVLQLSFAKALCLVLLSWSCAVMALSLGSPQLLSHPADPLRVEIPIRLTPEDQVDLATINVLIPNRETYSRLGISSKILDLNPQAMVYRNQQERLMVLIETVEPVPVSDDPFLDLLLNMNWSSGSISKTFTLLLGDVQKITVKPGQTLSEIAAQIAPQLDGATIDQTILALFKANPDAFASGSINQLLAGAELSKPSQALLRSISPAEANHFVVESNQQWHTEQSEKAASSKTSKGEASPQDSPAQDRLKIGSNAEGNAEQRRYTEDLVAQEKMLEQTRAKVAELEKNIAELQGLIEKAKQNKSAEVNLGLGGFAPAAVALTLIAATGLLLWFLARNARRSESNHYPKPIIHFPVKADALVSAPVPDRAKALLAGIDLDLSAPAKNSNSTPAPAVMSSQGSLAVDALRVKLNLARAYITIEDFAAAKKSLAEVLAVSDSVDPSITIEAQGLLAELQHRNH